METNFDQKLHDDDGLTQKLRPRDDEEVIEHATDIIGEWGPYQRWVIIVLTSIYIIAPFQNIGIVLYAPKLKFWCKRPPGFENFTTRTCQSYENESLPCTEFEYDMDGFRSTIIDEWDLVCDRAWLASSAKSIYQIGYLVSSIVFGILADKYGRLRAMKWAIIMEIVSGLGQAGSQSIYQFLFARFFLGVAAWARFLTGALIIIEIVGPTRRAQMKVLNELGWTAGRVLLPIVMYFVLHFRYMQVMVAIYEIVLMFFIWKTPESPRWQLTHGQYAGAEKTILEAVKMNKNISEEEARRKLIKLKAFIDKEEKERESEASKTLFDLWRVPSLLKTSAILYVVWFSTAFISYGFGYNLGDLGVNLFGVMMIQAVAGAVSFVIVICVVDRVDRRPFGVVSFWGRGALLLAMVPFFFVDNNAPYMLAIVFIAGIFGGGGWQASYLFATEIFPTTLRQIGVGSCSVAARIASTMSPFIQELTAATHVSVSVSFLAGLAFLGGTLIVFLPETRNREIPDAIEEARALGKKKTRGDIITPC